jgi:hypothetical protein
MNDFEYINPLWRLADPLTVGQAAALIAGFDPNAVRFNIKGGVYFESETGLTDSNGGSWVQTAYAALKNAVNSGKLKATIRRTAWERGWNEEPDFDAGERWSEKVDLLESDVNEAWGTDPTFIKRSQIIYRVEPDWEKTTIDRSSVKEWLANNGIHTGFFFPDSTDAPDYLDPKNPRYAPKLAAAVRVWQAMEDENLRRGKNPFSAMEQYLESRYKEYGLFHEKDNPKNGTVAGDINKTAISEVAKVANWQPGGGAPKTPG